MDNKIVKFAGIAKQKVDENAMKLINKQTLSPLTADHVYTFRIAACDNLVDRDFEQFSDKALTQLAKLYIGKTILSDHNWSAALQTARIYDSTVEVAENGSKQLVLSAYMLKNDSTQATIEAIEGGILREVSVGCRMGKAICSICKNDKRKCYCEHCPGRDYDDKKCTVTLDDALDAYEVSFVAVPAQPAAGVRKTYGGEENKPESNKSEEEKLKTKIRLYEAEIRYLDLED